MKCKFLHLIILHHHILGGASYDISIAASICLHHRVSGMWLLAQNKPAAYASGENINYRDQDREVEYSIN